LDVDRQERLLRFEYKHLFGYSVTKDSVMNFKLLASAIVLPLSLTMTLPAFAQTTDTPSAPTQADRMPRHARLLNLTPEQQAQLEEIRQNARSQIDAILTSEQKAQLEAAREERQQARQSGQPGERPEGRRGRGDRGFEALNLTADQRTQIEAVKNDTREQMDAILTPEQRQQLEQHRQQHEQRRQASPSS
jgi:periplasmic protein CpxP/Spy